MLNRILFLLVAVGAPASAMAMLYVDPSPAGPVSLIERVPCLALAAVAITLGVLHARAGSDHTSAAEAAMWCGLATFLIVAAFASPHLGFWVYLALVSLAGTSVVRLVERLRRAAVPARSSSLKARSPVAPAGFRIV